MYYYGRYNNATNGGTTGTGTAGASSTGAAPPEPVSEYSQPDNSYYYNANNGTANTNPSNSNNTSNYYYDSNTYGYSAMGANNYDQQQPYVSAAATTQAQQPATSQQHQLNAHQQSHAPPASWGLPYSYTQQYMPPQQYQQPQQPQQYMPQTNPSTENTTSATPHHVTTATPSHPQSFQRPPIHHQMQQSNPTLLSANHSGNEYYQDYKYDPQQQTIQNTTQSVVQPPPQQMQQISQHHPQQPPHMQHPQQQQQQHFHHVKSMVPPSGTTAPTSINHNNAANATSKSPPSFQLSPNAGQIQPPGSRPKITTTMWEDEKTLCYQVESKGVSVVRRADNNMINGTKLLNVAKMTRGRRDGILKTEKIRHVVKIGSMHLKGVWIPFERALIMAQREGISDSLYPLFVKDIQKIIQQGTPTVKMGQYVINSSNGSTAAPQITDESENTRKDGKDY